MKKKFNLLFFFTIILSSILLGFIYNYYSADSIDWIREKIIVQNVTNINSVTSDSTINGLDLAQVVQLHSKKLAVFVDARDQWEYSAGHISGAINIPEFSFETDNKSIDEINKENILVLYCDGDDCDISKRLAKQLIKLGYSNTFVYLGGFYEWKEAGLPINFSTEK